MSSSAGVSPRPSLRGRAREASEAESEWDSKVAAIEDHARTLLLARWLMGPRMTRGKRGSSSGRQSVVDGSERRGSGGLDAVAS